MERGKWRRKGLRKMQIEMIGDKGELHQISDCIWEVAGKKERWREYEKSSEYNEPNRSAENR